MFSENLEAVLVGSLVLRSDAVFELPASFSPGMLQGSVAKKALVAIRKLTSDKKPIDLPLVLAEARLAGGEADWLRDAVLNHATTNSVTPYAERVQEQHRRAQMRGLLAGAIESIEAGDVSEIAGALAAKLTDLDTPERPESVTFREAALETLNHLEASKLGSSSVLKTGFPTLDALVRIRKGNMVVLAARPGVGKSTLALNIAENVALARGPVLFHSLEMDDVELIGRVISRATEIYADRFFSDAPFSSAEWERTALAVGKRADVNLPLHINTAHHSLASVCRITEKLHRKHGLALVVVDYLQLVEIDLGKNATDESRIGTVSRTLKLMAQRLRIPVLAVAQLNREIEKRAQGRGEENQGVAPPRLSDLRGSGRIEQDANTVMFLHNPHAADQDRDAREHGPFEVVVAKQRLGRRGSIRLRAELGFAQFVEPRADVTRERYP